MAVTSSPPSTQTLPSPNPEKEAPLLRATSPRKRPEVTLGLESVSLATSDTATHSPSGSELLVTLATRSEDENESTPSKVNVTTKALAAFTS